MFSAFVKLLRPQQWIKNLFLFIPIFFAGDLFELQKLQITGLGFIIFSIIASSVYVINDIRDVNIDRNHPQKKYRPLATGAIPMPLGYIIFATLSIVGFLSAYLLGFGFFIVLLAYYSINIGYSFGLKNISIIDLILVSVGFVLRVVSGGILAGVTISHWLIIMVFLLSLVIVLAKRRDDMLESVKSGEAVRASSKRYNMEFISSILTMLSAIIVVAYIMYTVSSQTVDNFNTDKLYLTSLFVVMGVLRYLQITLVDNKSGYPTRILYTDRFIQFTLFSWVLSFYVIIYYL